MKRQARGYMQSFETPASRVVLWRALTDPAMLKVWYAAEALVEPRLGGRYSVTSRLFGRRDATIEHFEPGMRMQLLYDPSPDWPPLAESALVEDFMIDERKGQRTIRVVGSGVPQGEEWERMLVRLRTGWALAFAQLQMRLREGSIGTPGA
ncbi:MAG: SRPBCC domain-containing protein [Gammaproteobacteria bacterium]